MTSDRRNRYPVADGVPVLLAEHKTLFGPGGSAPPGTRIPRSDDPRRRLMITIDDLVTRGPSISRNLAARDNYRHLASLLALERPDRLSRKRLLVVGGATTGAGIVLCSTPHTSRPSRPTSRWVRGRRSSVTDMTCPSATGRSTLSSARRCSLTSQILTGWSARSTACSQTTGWSTPRRPSCSTCAWAERLHPLDATGPQTSVPALRRGSIRGAVRAGDGPGMVDQVLRVGPCGRVAPRRCGRE